MRSFLTSPDHSLYEQSWQPHEMVRAKINADGFGFGWYPQPGKPTIYRSIYPIWSDHNLPEIGAVLEAPLWLAMVRSATLEGGLSPANTQPFRYGRYLYIHNGFIEDFNNGARTKILAELSAEIVATINGHTDSEYLFALFCQFANDASGGLEQALLRLVKWCQSRLGDNEVAINLICSDGEQTLALRYAHKLTAPSLYWSKEAEGFPSASVLVASEPFSERGNWHSVPAGRYLAIANRSAPEAQLKAL